MAMLTEEIATLRARIVELENPGFTSPSITLYDPYGRFKAKSHSPPVPEPPRPGPFSPASTTSTHPSGRHRYNFTALESMTSYIGSSVSPSRPLISLSPTSNTEVCLDSTGEGVLYSSYAWQEPPSVLIPSL